MKAREALRVLAGLSASQWGLVTTAQAVAHGLSRLDLARLADAGQLIRLSNGVYRDAGAPSDEYEELRAAWLATDPGRLAEARLGEGAAGVVVSGTSAAWLHDIGDLRTDQHEFTASVRRQSQRAEIHYRQRVLDPIDVTLVGGLPATTRERTIADLVEARVDLSLIADALGDAARAGQIDRDRLAELLKPLAARNGLRRGDGAALLNRLTEIAGLDLDSLARQVAESGEFGARVVTEFLRRLPSFEQVRIDQMPGLQGALSSIGEVMASTMQEIDASYINVPIAAMLDSPGFKDAMSSVAKLQKRQLDPVLDAVAGLSKDWVPSVELAQLVQSAIPVVRGVAVKEKEGDGDE